MNKILLKLYHILSLYTLFDCEPNSNSKGWKEYERKRRLRHENHTHN